MVLRVGVCVSCEAGNELIIKCLNTMFHTEIEVQVINHHLILDVIIWTNAYHQIM